MLNKIKQILKKIFNIFGLQLNKLNLISIPAYQTVQALKAHQVDLVFDVGANVGQYAQELRKYGYTGRIVSFEPLQNAYKVLSQKASKDESWVAHDRCAIGETDGIIEINVAANSESSSILPMLETHERSAPESKYTHSENVNVSRLDGIYEQYYEKGDKVFLKIDTQGYEWSVLDGSEKLLSECTGVSLELSLIPLYKNQKLWDACEARLKASGFSLFTIQPCFTDTKTGQTLQVDGLFFKSLDLHVY